MRRATDLRRHTLQAKEEEEEEEEEEEATASSEEMKKWGNEEEKMFGGWWNEADKRSKGNDGFVMRGRKDRKGHGHGAGSIRETQ